MIQLIEGVPGSGKSYFAVNYLYGFTEFDKLYNEFILESHVLIISNIEGLKIKHWSLNKCLGLKIDDELGLADPKKVIDFFSIKNFENIQKTTKKSHVILLIDEAHKIFPKELKEKSIYEFFADHRHIGLDVFFMTQGLESMTRMFNPLLESIIKAKPRSKKVTKSFSYSVCDLKGKFLRPQMIVSKQEVFNAYKSFRADEKNKPKSAITFWAGLVVCFFLVGGGLMTFAVKGISAKGEIETAKEPVKSALETITTVKKRPPSTKTFKQMVMPAVIESNEPWITYYLDGYVEQNGNLYFLINGVSVADCDRFRNFDRITSTVEYFGKEIKRRTARPFERKPINLDARRRMTAGAKPLGVASS